MASKVQDYDFSLFIKIWLPMIVAVVLAVVGMQTWIADHYYSADSASALELRVDAIDQTMSKISDQNDMIIEKLGFISGKLDTANK